MDGPNKTFELIAEAVPSIFNEEFYPKSAHRQTEPKKRKPPTPRGPAPPKKAKLPKNDNENSTSQDISDDFVPNFESNSSEQVDSIPSVAHRSRSPTRMIDLDPPESSSLDPPNNLHAQAFVKILNDDGSSTLKYPNLVQFDAKFDSNALVINFLDDFGICLRLTVCLGHNFPYRFNRSLLVTPPHGFIENE